MPDLYIPPKELPVRIYGFQSTCVLVPSGDDLWHHASNEVKEDNWWFIVPGTGKFEGYYYIKSKWTGKVIFSRTHMNPHVGLIDGDGKFNDNYFKLEPGTGGYEGYFRLRNFESNTVLFSRNFMDPQVDNYRPDRPSLSGDQYFKFLYGDMEVVGIKYFTERGRVLSTEDVVLGSEKQINDTSVEQSVTLKLIRIEENSATFEHTHGFAVKIGTSFSVGMPIVAKGKITAEVSTNHEFKWGTGHTLTNRTEIGVPVKAPAHTTVIVQAVAKRSIMDVPYTMTLRSKAANINITSDGIYKGTTHWDIDTKFSQKP